MSSEKRTKNELLYDDAMKRMKSKEKYLNDPNYDPNARHTLPQSRRILYKNFTQKFSQIMEKLDIVSKDDAKVEYDQYLIVVKSLIFCDQNDEAKISENREVFEGWTAMRGDRNGYVTRESLRSFLLNVLDLTPQSNKTSAAKEINSINVSKIVPEKKESEKSAIQTSTIDLLNDKEPEVRLDVLDSNYSTLSQVQRMYKDIKGAKKPLHLPVKKSVKNFFSLKLKENKLKSGKTKDSREAENVDNKSNFVQ